LLSAINILCGLLNWIFISDQQEGADEGNQAESVYLRKAIVKVFKLPAVWMVGLIILCAYSNYDGITYLTPYATDVYKQSVVFGGILYGITMWTSVIASPLAGVIADRISTSLLMIIGFVMVIIGWMIFLLVGGTPALCVLLICNSILIAVGIYAMRGIYYALLEEGNIPLILTGTATGLISLVAYTPDIFIPYIGGHFLDAYPGELGYRYLFAVLLGLTVFGLIMSIVFRVTSKEKRRQVIDDRKAKAGVAVA
jgi:MFS family permease